MPAFLADLTMMTELTITDLSRVKYSSDVTSKSHHGIFSEKYYVDDDYDDPTFYSDIAFYKGFRTGADVHVLTIQKCMGDLDVKLKKQEWQTNLLNADQLYICG